MYPLFGPPKISPKAGDVFVTSGGKYVLVVKVDTINGEELFLCYNLASHKVYHLASFFLEKKVA